ncbi:hypothetical protein GBO14_05460 [Pseudoalteromonas shioyasakiensis]|uniref:hypothetical protein n=1 Tax=Pseudoalteromonas shioyasakiensis TaxID=1190813 RepID=UPI002094CDA6|nr:hypothetical protein [Pseudoalteromonas shioyasakiensis]MCO6354197.1 hypothetical protein [Pseudoalteromonas shioyasakiensis]
MSNSTKKYEQISLSSEDVASKLNGASPLQASRILIDMELFEQRSSLDVIDNVYKDFESNQNVVDELVTPLGLSVLDSVITHKDLKLDRTGLTASRLWEDINCFEYKNIHASSHALSTKQQLKGSRKVTPGKRGNVQKHKLEAHKVKNTRRDGTIKNDLDGKKLYRQGQGSSTLNTVNTEHLQSSESFHRQFGGNILLTKENGKTIVNSDENLASISERQNKMKLDGTFANIKEKKEQLLSKKKTTKLSKSEQEQLDRINESFTGSSLEAGVAMEKEAAKSNFKAAQDAALNNIKDNTAEIATQASTKAGEQTGHQALGHAVLLMLKPIFYEFNDSFKNGIDAGVGEDSALEGLKVRLKRVMQYIRTEIVPTLTKALKDFFDNFCKVIIDSIIGLATGIFKSILTILIEGFSALVGALKILSKSSNEMSGAQKADAILKLFSATVVTFVVFYFESSILPAIPIPFLQDIALALLSGIASSLVVYVLDKADIFSTKSELRTKRIKEIFEMRVQQIKENTDAFETASLQKLAEDKLRFKALSDSLSQSIQDKKDPNDAVLKIADFLKVELSVKSTDDFLNMLKTQDSLEIA